MAQPKVKVIGRIRYTESGGLRWDIHTEGKSKECWIEVLPNALAMNWPGIAKSDDRESYSLAMHADPLYRATANRYIELQQQVPQYLIGKIWVFRGALYVVEQAQGEPAVQPDMARLLIKRYVLRCSRDYQKIQREVETLENLEKIESSSRESIPEAVRLFVWQRDKGRCVKCGSQQRLEFDHIIPISSGGSNTERNIQLLCEPCNRSKGATI